MKKTVWQGRYLAAIDDDGWEYVARPNGLTAVVIVAIDDGHVLLVEQERKPVGRRVLELPAGLVGDDDPDETPLVAAGRELEEETGWRAGTLETLGDYYSSPGLTSEAFTVVRATDLARVGDGGGTDSEQITVHRVALADLAGFIRGRRAAGVGVDTKLWLVLDLDAI